MNNALLELRRIRSLLDLPESADVSMRVEQDFTNLWLAMLDARPFVADAEAAGKGSAHASAVLARIDDLDRWYRKLRK